MKNLTRGEISVMKAQMLVDRQGPWQLGGPQISPEEWAERELEKLAQREKEEGAK